ncbi:MAG: mechanosensitive ion channel family protein [Acidobacteriota bacterium]|nr:mechanosensitive ion channel family protein [Acidobacteriota bacterium]
MGVLEWSDFQPYQKALLVLDAALAMTLLVRMLITRIVSRFASKTKTEMDDRLISAFQHPVAWAILAYGIWTAAKIVWPDTSWALRVALYSSVIIMWGIAILRFGSFFIDTVSEMPHRYQLITPRTKPLYHMLLKFIAIMGALYLVLVAWQQDITAWLASAGVAGIAIGFAAKDTLANFFSGIFIIADAPYKIGDYIVLDNGDRGRITDIGVRSTRMMTRDDVEIIIPNAIIGNSTIINQSGGPYEKYRLRVPVGVAYGSDVDQVRAVLMRVADEEPLVMPDPVHRVRFRAFGNSSLDFELLVWVETPELRGLALDRMLTSIYKAFAAEGVEIPFPKRDVYLHHVDDDTQSNTE